MFRRSALRASACATAAFAAVGSARSDASHADSPFTYPALERAIRERRARERKLATYVATVSPMIASARAEVDAAARNAARDPAALERARLRFARLADRVRAETSALTWGRADAERERDAFVRRYGCVGWTDGALDVIAEHAPIVEIGAGRGLWQRELQRRGVDVLAYDDQSAIPGDADENYLASSSSSPPPSSPRGRVRVGNESALRSWRVRRENRTLLLVYPEGDLLPRCLRAYGGEVVLFVGEGRGGVNGDARAFDELEREWEVRRIVDVKPFEGGHEKLWELVRKKKRRETSSAVV